MRMLTFQHRARSRQSPHRHTSKEKRELRKRLTFIGITKQLQRVAGEPLHQQQIENEHDEVEQQAAIFRGEKSSW